MKNVFRSLSHLLILSIALSVASSCGKKLSEKSKAPAIRSIDNSSDPITKEEVLLTAILTQDLTIIKQKIQEGADINALLSNQKTPLVTAILQGHSGNSEETIRFEIIKYLLENNADPNLGNGCEYPLILAVERSDRPIINLLLERNANVNLTNCEGRTSLHIALSLNRSDIVRSLVIQGAADVTGMNPQGESIAQLAQSLGENSLSTLIETARRVQQNDLSYAYIDTLLTLNAQDSLHFLIQRRRTLPNGINLSVVARRLALATSAVNRIQNLDKILSSGININSTYNKFLALIAIEQADMELLNLLAQKAMEFNAINQDGDSVLALAVKNFNTDFVTFLVEHGATRTYLFESRQIDVCDHLPEGRWRRVRRRNADIYSAARAISNTLGCR